MDAVYDVTTERLDYKVYLNYLALMHLPINVHIVPQGGGKREIHNDKCILRNSHCFILEVALHGVIVAMGTVAPYVDYFRTTKMIKKRK